ncbi:MAG TPA: aldehyde dehydrogenase [Deltaproteobacteria bacterium]|nr:aldehyde dehydrogenase [Deltaproteobacteria bacterium]
MSRVFPSFDPATLEPIGEVERTDVKAVGLVVERARAAAPAWRGLGVEARRDVLRRAQPLLMDQVEAIGELLTREMGKPLREATGEVRACARGLGEGLDEMVAALQPETLRDERTHTVRYRDPFGVAAVITPWNFPVSMPHGMVIPALMAGNTVVLKPSEETPLVAAAWAEILCSVLPTDVLQVVQGDEAQGRALVAADVDLVAFTGSREAGAQILSAAGHGLKRVVLELGGKDPLVVLDDADVEAAAAFAVRNSFRNAGQVCVSTERIYVAEPIADAFEARVIALARELVVGPGLEPDTDVGPMINARQKGRVLSQIRSAVGQGARLHLGGEEGEGNWLHPTVLTGVDHRMEIMREETFGPVACLMRFSEDREAIRLANDTPFGLGAVVFSGDDERGWAVARRLEAGMVGLNRGVGGARGAPWVGAKQSGYGFHSGIEGHRQFAQVRIVSVPTS